jgi:uncharacterized membrane protein
MMNKLINPTLIILAIVCAILSAAPFNPAVFVSLLLVAVGGIYGFYHYSLLAALLLILGAVSVFISPVLTLQSELFWLVLVAFGIGYGGVLWGMWRRRQLRTGPSS